MNKEAKTIQQQVFKQLDEIAQSIEKIHEVWETNLIPVDTIETIINSSIVPVNELQDETMINFMTKYNEMLSAIVKASKEESKAMGSDKLPISVFRSYINSCKAAFNGTQPKKRKWSDKFKRQPA
jgi:dsDNA-binding SOS-regulon protein